MYSIHNRNVGASLIEINKGMSELLDKQVDTENENLKIKIPGFTQALVNCAMKIKESRRIGRRKWLPHKFFYLKEDFIRLYQKTGSSDFNKFQGTDSTLNEGTNSLINERKGQGQMVRCVLSQNERYKTHNG